MRRLCMAFLTALLIPYVVTLAWTGRIGGAGGAGLGWNMRETQEESLSGIYSGRSIILDNHSGEYIDMETYLVGVAARQIPAEYELEAIKAQVVIARTYLCGKMGDCLEIRESELGLPALGQQQLETLWGKNEFLESYEKMKQAVAETRGMILVAGASSAQPEATDLQPENVEIIEPLFHQVSAGYTRDGGEAYPYLKPVESPHDLEAEGYLTVLEWEPAEFVQLLSSETVIGESHALESLQLVSKDGSGYVKEFQIGSHIFTGDRLMQLLGLPSAAFSLSVHEGNIRAVCQGIGHGYGLSQYGAHRMALDGRTAEEILSYYYQNVAIISIES